MTKPFSRKGTYKVRLLSGEVAELTLDEFNFIYPQNCRQVKEQVLVRRRKVVFTPEVQAVLASNPRPTPQRADDGEPEFIEV